METQDPQREALIQALDHVPHSPGVYLMKNANRRVLYVGKALDLRKRLSTYFSRPQIKATKTQAMIRHVAEFETLITHSEKEALILESNLIKQHKPKYNVILKDDKRYPSLCLNTDHPFPRLKIVRRTDVRGCIYFGPFASALAVRQTLKFINKTFKLRKCKPRDFATRTRPCLHHQMGTCMAPCCFKPEPGVYETVVKEVTLFLKGQTSTLIKSVEAQMQRAALEQDFERAATLRDKMFALEKTLEKQVVVSTDFKDRDVIAVAEDDGICTFGLLSVRGGYLLGSQFYHYELPMDDKSAALSQFTRQYYGRNHPIPKEVIVGEAMPDLELIAAWLSERRGNRVYVVRPQRGVKVRLLIMAQSNTDQALKDHIAKIEADARLIERLREKLKLRYTPQRIECFDNSNIAGKHPVAGMVVFEKGRPQKTAYRRFRIKEAHGEPDDYRYMYDVLKRRFSGSLSEKEPHPNLVIVDGGKGQLNVAVAILDELGLKDRFDVISLAKKNAAGGEIWDKVYTPGRMNPISLERDKDLLFLLMRIRDEAHRFAIAFHRRTRRRENLTSELDRIKGIGERRRQRILQHFGSVKNVRAATLEQLSGLPGMNRKAAKAIADYFNHKAK
jgi:excinuclease ABC subunit C